MQYKWIIKLHEKDKCVNNLIYPVLDIASFHNLIPSKYTNTDPRIASQYSNSYVTYVTLGIIIPKHLKGIRLGKKWTIVSFKLQPKDLLKI